MARDEPELSAIEAEVDGSCGRECASAASDEENAADVAVPDFSRCIGWII